MAREMDNTHYVLWCVFRLGGELYSINDYFYDLLARNVTSLILRLGKIVHVLEILWKGGLILGTYAIDMAIGFVLMQEGRVITYESKKLNNTELNYSVHEKELLAIIHALKVVT